MLLPCPSCKKPVFVSGSVLSAGPADVQCSNCTALLKIHPDGSTDLVEGHATETGEAPELELPEAEAPVQTGLGSPESRGTIELDETNSQWREPAAREVLVASEMPAPAPSEPSVSEPARRDAPLAVEPLLQEPPADWPIAPAAMGRDEDTALTDAQFVAPIPVAFDENAAVSWSSSEARENPPPLSQSTPQVVADAAAPVADAAAPDTLACDPSPAADTRPQVPASPPPLTRPVRDPAVLGGLDSKKPVARLRGTEVVEIHSGPRNAPPPPPPEPDLRARLRNAKPVTRDTLTNLIPEAVLFTVDPSQPRWSNSGVASARAASSSSDPVPPAVPAPTPEPIAPAPSPSVGHYPEPPLSGATATPAFGGSPPTAPTPTPEPARAPTVAVSPPPPPTADEVEMDDPVAEGGSPGKMLAIAAALIAVVGGAVYFMGDGTGGTAVTSADPAETEVLDPLPARGEAGEPANVGDDAALRVTDVADDGEEAPHASALDEPLAVDAESEVSEDDPSELQVEFEASAAGRDDGAEAAPATKPRPLATRAAKPKATPKPIPTRPAPKPAPPSSAVSMSSRDVVRADQLYLRANQLLSQEKVALAIETLKDAIELNPRHGKAYRSLGVSYMKLGQPRSAIAAYKKFVELSPTHRDAEAARQIIANYSTR